VPWLKPSLALRWGSYTKLDGDEQQQIVDATIKSHEAGLITLRMAVEKLAPIYGIENVDAVLEALKKEGEEKQKAALANAAAMKKIEGGVAPNAQSGASKEEQPAANQPGT
jgi:N-methylhydantoinase B/oxoprolinase/acetone carboxylase alpha subunit